MGSPVEANNLHERGESMAAEFRATRVTLPGAVRAGPSTTGSRFACCLKTYGEYASGAI
jgi:hypothetical protein